ncbi:heterodisulfide reductase-related iron-sulfur binding cluster [Adlercreutzia sp. ZJ304]|uniref:heterodisulfide reductase-related iron-sulfur binding cluster n=1 Tax=Adlercreutzia sp. ZJ304 TaxID=2709791 RepID=UPI0013E9AA3C|nr:heterodisulfide reductase-related iron-sulfur binding cluster [Adlercreutzia sp. ZJ304]
MVDFEFIDALTGDKVGLIYTQGQAALAKVDGNVPNCKSIFFSGCSLLNYAMPLVPAIYNTLLDAGEVDGLSVLCCGKILSYEPNGDVLRASFEDELRNVVAATSIKRFVCACPNCVKALRDAFSKDVRTKDIAIDVLPQTLADIGYKLNPKTCARLIKGDENAEVLFCPHDSCPDRESGDFARGLRALIPDGMWADPKHAWRRSVCCGSLPRAAGKFKQADKCADINGREALEVGSDAIITACMSCDFQLNMAQPHIQCVHYLEMLYDWRINWSQVGDMMKLRFLFNDTLGVIDSSNTQRLFEGMSSSVLDNVEDDCDECRID